MKSKRFKIAGLIALSLVLMVTIAACDTAPTPDTYTLSGTVTLKGGDADLEDVSISVEDADETSTVNPEADGEWTATVVEGDVTVTPALDDYTFSPENWTAEDEDDVDEDVDDIEFEGTDD